MNKRIRAGFGRTSGEVRQLTAEDLRIQAENLKRLSRGSHKKNGSEKK